MLYKKIKFLGYFENIRGVYRENPFRIHLELCLFSISMIFEYFVIFCASSESMPVTEYCFPFSLLAFSLCKMAVAEKQERSGST